MKNASKAPAKSAAATSRKQPIAAAIKQVTTAAKGKTKVAGAGAAGAAKAKAPLPADSATTGKGAMGKRRNR